MEIEIEKFRHIRKNITVKDYSLAVELCMKKNVETGFFQRFWRRFLPEMDFVHIKFSCRYEIYKLWEINVYTTDELSVASKKWNVSLPTPKFLSDLGQYSDTSDKYESKCEWKICGTKN